MTSFGAYLEKIKKNLAHGDATEHTHCPAMKELLESIGHSATKPQPRRSAGLQPAWPPNIDSKPVANRRSITGNILLEMRDPSTL